MVEVLGMRVSSPIGDFPFNVATIRVADNGLVVEGEMGAWPASVHVEASDVVAVARAVPKPVWLVGFSVLVVLVRLLRGR
jgi:hypothetical protein